MNNHPHCIDLRKKLMDYLDGDLDIKSCEELEAHIAACVDCQINVDTLRKTLEICKKSAMNNPLPSDIRARLYRCLDMDEFL
jgi:anti-sigma factor (TIGR02949 family)